MTKLNKTIDTMLEVMKGNEPQSEDQNGEKATIFLPDPALVDQQEPQAPVSEEAKAEMRRIYNVRPTYVNGMYITRVQQNQSHLLRIVFSEHNFAIQENIPVCGIIMTLEDFINNYKLQTEVLNGMKAQGILK